MRPTATAGWADVVFGDLVEVAIADGSRALPHGFHNLVYTRRPQGTAGSSMIQ